MILDYARAIAHSGNTIYLYHTNKPEGQIFKESDDISKLTKEGWVDCPTKVAKKGKAKKEADDGIHQ